MGKAANEVVRVETALSRFPMHRLTKLGTADIALSETTDDGVMTLKWEVSHNSKHGQPGPLAYKIDTLVINREIEKAGRPVPRVIRLGSLADIAEVTGTGGGNTPLIKRALYQNASAFITAKITYKSKDGKTRTTEIGDTRYAVVFTGETLPDGRKADAVHVVLHDFYREILDNALTRPLDYDYLRSLAPVSQRFYELASFQVFAAVTYGNKAKLSYAEFCMHAPQLRYFKLADVRKQMAKVHAPHLEAGYIEDIVFDPKPGRDGLVDWMMTYVPGPKAKADHATNGKRALSSAPLPESELVGDLVGRGVTRAVAVELVKSHSSEHIRSQIEAVELLQAKRPGKVKDGGAYLANAIRNDYAKPLSAGRVQGRAVPAQDTNNAKVERARQQEEATRIDAFWNNLTPVQQRQLEADAMANADEETRAGATTGTPSMRRVGLKVIRNDHIRTLLTGGNGLPPDTQRRDS